MHTAEGVPDAPILRTLGWALAGSGTSSIDSRRKWPRRRGRCGSGRPGHLRLGFRSSVWGGSRASSWASDVGSPAHRAGRGSSIQTKENAVFTLWSAWLMCGRGEWWGVGLAGSAPTCGWKPLVVTGLSSPAARGRRRHPPGPVQSPSPRLPVPDKVPASSGRLHPAGRIPREGLDSAPLGLSLPPARAAHSTTVDSYRSGVLSWVYSVDLRRPDLSSIMTGMSSCSKDGSRVEWQLAVSMAASSCPCGSRSRRCPVSPVSPTRERTTLIPSAPLGLVGTGCCLGQKETWFLPVYGSPTGG